jgi:hypothetical protein
MKLDAIGPKNRKPDEPILNCNKSKELVDFWQWAYSDLVGNTERGILAEYLVALACDIENTVRIGWNAFDLEVNGIKIEVKSSAYLQTWEQSKISSPVFGIAKTKAWDYIKNIYAETSERQADVYVFALLSHQDKETLNPLDTNQWDFYVLDRKTIDLKANDQKQLTLNTLCLWGANKCSYNDLKHTIQEKSNHRKGINL